MAAMLRQMGFSARACYGGAKALNSAQQAAALCVVLDVDMPGMDELKLARAYAPSAATTSC